MKLPTITQQTETRLARLQNAEKAQMIRDLIAQFAYNITLVPRLKHFSRSHNELQKTFNSVLKN